MDIEMISEEVRTQIAKYDQTHILKYYDAGELNEEEMKNLEDQVASKCLFLSGRLTRSTLSVSRKSTRFPSTRLLLPVPMLPWTPWIMY